MIRQWQNTKFHWSDIFKTAPWTSTDIPKINLYLNNVWLVVSHSGLWWWKQGRRRRGEGSVAGARFCVCVNLRRRRVSVHTVSPLGPEPWWCTTQSYSRTRGGRPRPRWNDAGAVHAVRVRRTVPRVLELALDSTRSGTCLRVSSKM